MDNLLLAIVIVVIFLIISAGVGAWQIGNMRGQMKQLRQQRPLFDTMPQTAVTSGVGHTHTFRKNSEHEEHGQHVIVKRCDCGEVIRDVS